VLAANSRSFKTDADLVPYPWNEDCDLTLELKQPPVRIIPAHMI
jgi:hypothetical protein